MRRALAWPSLCPVGRLTSSNAQRDRSPLRAGSSGAGRKRWRSPRSLVETERSNCCGKRSWQRHVLAHDRPAARRDCFDWMRRRQRANQRWSEQGNGTAHSRCCSRHDADWLVKACSGLRSAVRPMQSDHAASDFISVASAEDVNEMIGKVSSFSSRSRALMCRITLEVSSSSSGPLPLKTT